MHGLTPLTASKLVTAPSRFLSCWSLLVEKKNPNTTKVKTKKVWARGFFVDSSSSLFFVFPLLSNEIVQTSSSVALIIRPDECHTTWSLQFFDIFAFQLPSSVPKVYDTMFELFLCVWRGLNVSQKTASASQKGVGKFGKLVHLSQRREETRVFGGAGRRKQIWKAWEYFYTLFRKVCCLEAFVMEIGQLLNFFIMFRPVEKCFFFFVRMGK